MNGLQLRLQSWAAQPAIRGLLGRCPRCGKGKIFHAFLKVSERCPSCSEELHHHRADDFPAYLVVVIVGHIVVAAALAIEVTFSPPLWLHALIFLPLTAGLALLLIQPVKGLVVAFQWQHGMEGFSAAKKLREAPAI